MSSSPSLSSRKIDDSVDGEFPSPVNPTTADPLQFFVRILSDHTHVLHADPGDTVRSIHEKIQSIAGIPVLGQRLIYLGKQLNWGQTLSDCGVQNDAALHLVGRMRSTGNPRSWRIINDVISLVLYLFKKNPKAPYFPPVAPQWTLKSMLIEFLKMTPPIDPDLASAHLQIFTDSLAPTALVMLYMSSHKPNRDAADNVIREFFTLCQTFLPKHCYHQCAPIMMEFCRLLRGALGAEDSLYVRCRSNLGTMVNSIEFGENEGSVGLPEIFPFLTELAGRLSTDLAKGTESASFCTIPSMTDVNDFIAYVGPVKNVIKGDRRFCGPIQFPLTGELVSLPPYFADAIINLHGMFSDLLSKMNDRMAKIDVELENARFHNVGRQFLALLKELNCISKIYHGCEEVFWESMTQRKEAFCYLIISSEERNDDHNWISECKEATNFEARGHMAMLLIPEVTNDYIEGHEMVIDRQDLFSESFEFIMNAYLSFLRSGLFIKFENEEATGSGVLREWFLLVCQEMVNPQNPLFVGRKPLFVACPNDHRRFFPNPASTVDPLDCDYFNFFGKLIAMALMHNVQVGILFDRIFFLQLGGHTITLEDIRDTNPFIYRGCKEILEMDPEVVDDLGLMFFHEIKELERTREVEFCPNGKNVAVNSENRRQFVESLIQHLFVNETAEQIDNFAMGFADVLGCRNLQRSFFRCLNLDDFDLMIRGSENEICVNDWRVHTEYEGFKETDDQISWFWEIVGGMRNEQKRILLFFWTSIKFLPIEGFGGLVSPLQIYKNHDPSDRLPSSNTCFYRLLFPAYPDMAAMRDRLSIITREHVSCGFGFW